jgi:Concanavalin A-like lectin/glucanases superfamily
MDDRRSCSKSKMQIQDPSGGITVIDIIWYFAPPGAKRYHYEQSFTSGIWDYDKIAQPPLLGEQPPYDTPWYNGKNIWGYLGQCVIGTPQQFLNGLSAADLAAPARPMPLCCGGLQPVQGGALAGGMAHTNYLNMDVAWELAPLTPPLTQAGSMGLKLGWGAAVTAISYGPAGIGLKLGWGALTAQTLLTGLQAFWPLHEASGSPRLDVSGGGHTMFETSGSVGQVAGLLGFAAQFTAAGYLQAAWSALLPTPFSVNMWWRPDAPTSATLMGTDGPPVMLWQETPTSLSAGAYTSSVTDANSNPTGVWEMHTLTCDGSTMRLFRNTVFQGSTPFAPPGGAGSITQLGNSPLVGGVGFCSMELVGVWSRVLTSGDMTTLYNSGMGKDYPF